MLLQILSHIYTVYRFGYTQIHTDNPRNLWNGTCKIQITYVSELCEHRQKKGNFTSYKTTCFIKGSQINFLGDLIENG